MDASTAATARKEIDGMSADAALLFTTGRIRKSSRVWHRVVRRFVPLVTADLASTSGVSERPAAEASRSRYPSCPAENQRMHANCPSARWPAAEHRGLFHRRQADGGRLRAAPLLLTYLARTGDGTGTARPGAASEPQSGGAAPVQGSVGQSIDRSVDPSIDRIDQRRSPRGRAIHVTFGSSAERARAN
jgi:hypothetical protein